MISIKQISRFRAAAIHLALSAAIAVATVTVMLTLWYPTPLFGAMGGMELLILIVGVDVAIGPLITLIIFDTRKKELVFDLAVVAALQLIALSYGVYAMHSGRPVFTVFNGQILAVIPAADLDPKDLALGRSEEFRSLSLTGPRLVATEEPTDPEERSNIAFGSLGGFGIQHLPKHYVPYADKRTAVLAAAHPLDELDLGDEDKERLRRYLSRSGRKAADLRCLPVSTKRVLLTGVFDAGSGDLLDILDIRPTLRQH